MTFETFQTASDLVSDLGFFDAQLRAIDGLESQIGMYTNQYNKHEKNGIKIRVVADNEDVIIPEALTGSFISMIRGCYQKERLKTSEALKEL